MSNIKKTIEDTNNQKQKQKKTTKEMIQYDKNRYYSFKL